MRSVVVEAAAEDSSGSDPRLRSFSSGDPERSGVLNVVSVGSERFAEAFESASVLFAEGAGGLCVMITCLSFSGGRPVPLNLFMFSSFALIRLE